MHAHQSGLQESLRSNYTKIPNLLLEKLYSSDLTSRELKVCLLILRETFGWQKDSAPMTRKIISLKTGIHLSHVSKIVSSLASKGLVRVDRSMRVNVLSLVIDSNKVALRGCEEARDRDPSPKEKGLQTTQTRHKVSGAKKAKGYAKTDPHKVSQIGVPKIASNQEPALKPRPLKESFKENTSLYDSEIIQSYLDSIRSQGKRHRERGSFLRLRDSGFTTAEIEEGLLILERSGIPGRSGEKPHSPMRWLEFGMDSLSLKIKRNLNSKRERAVQKVPNKVQTLKTESSRIGQTESELAFKRFREFFPNEKEQVLEKKKIVEHYRSTVLDKKFGSLKLGDDLCFKLGLLEWDRSQKQAAAA